jgi:hypothetical protein
MDSIYKILESLDQVNEGTQPEVERFMDAVVKAGDGGYDMIYDALMGRHGPAVRNKIEDMYGDVAREKRLHPDDDSEQITSALLDQITDNQKTESIEEGMYDGKSREELLKLKAEAEAWFKKNPGGIGSTADSTADFLKDTEQMQMKQHLDDINDALKKVGESVEEAEITPIDHSEEEDGASAEDIASAITRRMMAHPKFGALVREVDIIDLNDAIEDIAQFHEGGDLGTSDVSNMVNDVLKQLGKPDALKEEEVEENAFNQAAAAAARAGKKEFEFGGKTHPVKMDKDTAHKLDDDINEDYDKDEYDEEGEMADNQLDTVADAAKELQDIIDKDDNLPEWVQGKITKAMDYLDTARDYMKSVEDDEETDDEETEEVEETTTAGSVAVTATGKGLYDNASVYESMNSKVENMITESMNVSVNSSNDPSAEPSITVSATGEDAMALAQLLQLAAVEKPACESCGRVHEGSCMNEAEEANSADNTHTYDMQYLLNAISGGLNGQKRQINPNNPGDNPMAMSAEKVVNIEESEDTGVSHLESLYKEFKAK